MLKTELIELLEELISKGGNYNTEKLLEIRKKFVSFLSKDEQLLGCQNDDNVIISKDAVHFIDAHNKYAITTDRREARNHMQRVFERLIKIEKWNYYELRFLIGSLNFTEDVIEALLLAEKVLEKLEDYQIGEKSGLLTGLLSFNVLSRLLYAKFLDDQSGVELESEFDRWFFKLEMLTEKINELKIQFDISVIRQAVFNLNSRLMNQMLEKFELTYDEKVVNALKNEVDFYIASKKHRELASEFMAKLYKAR